MSLELMNFHVVMILCMCNDLVCCYSAKLSSLKVDGSMVQYNQTRKTEQSHRLVINMTLVKKSTRRLADNSKCHGNKKIECSPFYN